jgi:hypothetical protein
MNLSVQEAEKIDWSVENARLLVTDLNETAKKRLEPIDFE